MYFSGAQWLGAIILDVFLRALFFFGYAPLFVMFSPLISVIYYGLLGAASAVMTGHKVHRRYSIPLTILIANIVVIGLFIAFLASSIKSGHMTSCRVESDQCRWINGTITELGMWTLAQEGIVQVVINLIPILIVWSLNIRPGQIGNES